METEYEKQNLKEFTENCAKRFCPWCGNPMKPGRRKFCTAKCRSAFWNFEYRHKDKKLELEAMLNENS